MNDRSLTLPEMSEAWSEQLRLNKMIDKFFADNRKAAFVFERQVEAALEGRRLSEEEALEEWDEMEELPIYSQSELEAMTPSQLRRAFKATLT
jgi:hypothetical protein